MAYWLGTKSGDVIEFKTRVPDDFAVILTCKDPSPGKSSPPRFSEFTRNCNGQSYTFTTNELIWYKSLDQSTPALIMQDGVPGSHNFTVDKSTADWSACRAILEANARANAFSAEWSEFSALVVQADSGTVKLSGDRSDYPRSKTSQAIVELDKWQDKTALSATELETVRNLMLEIANEGRANPNYRREAGCKKDLDLKANLPPLVMSAVANAAAQNQADYCAAADEVSHDQENATYRLKEEYKTFATRAPAFGLPGGSAEAAGGGKLSLFPTIWMKSETHYGGFWDCGTQPVASVGIGIARGPNAWHGVMVFTV